VIVKAFKSEHKVIFKYKDIEEIVIRNIGLDLVWNRIQATEVVKSIKAASDKYLGLLEAPKKKKTMIVSKK
jgi:hypothetical protein